MKDRDLNKSMQKEIKDKIIERINSLQEESTITFAGGEPFMYYNDMEYIVKGINNDKISYNFVTNGSYKNEFYKISKLLKETPSVYLSNKEGITPFKLNNKSRFRFVATPLNIKDVTDEYIAFIKKQFNNNIDLAFNFFDKWTEEDMNNASNLINRFAYYIPKFHLVNNPNEYIKGTLCPSNGVIINWNGDYLSCDVDETSILGNVVNDDFILCPTKKCLYENTEIKENFNLVENFGIMPIMGDC